MKMNSTEYIQILDGKLKYFGKLTCLCSIQNTEEQNMFCCRVAVG